MKLISLQFKTTNNFETNLHKLVSLISTCDTNTFILAPEVCITGFSYDNFNEASLFSSKVIQTLKELSSTKIIALTLIIKEDNNYFNELHIFHKKSIIYKQKKAKLFSLGNEDKYFSNGDENDIQIIEINGIKVASLICFELRFIELWQKIKGSDIILIPAMWGKLRVDNFKVLTNALAITNQCYVISSDSSNVDMASSSGIINPFGLEIRDDTQEILSMEFNQQEIKKMRRYIDIGIN